MTALNPEALRPFCDAAMEARATLRLAHDYALIDGRETLAVSCNDAIRQLTAALALAEQPPSVTADNPTGWDARSSASMRKCLLEEDTVDHDS